MAGAAIGAGTALARIGASNLRRSGRDRIPSHLRSSSASVDFPCDFLCTECGRMEPPGPGGEGPGERPCPHCGEAAWADLRAGGVVEALAEHDDDRRDQRAEVSRLGSLLSLAFGGLLLAWMLAGIVQLTLATITDPPDLSEGQGAVWFVFLMFIAFMVGAGVGGAGLLRRGIRGLRASAPPSLPTRWRYAIVPLGLLTPSREGSVAGEANLKAPFSGEPCLGYGVGVRIDDEERGAAWSWSAVVQETGRVSFEGTPLPPALFLDLQPRPMRRPEPGTPEAARVDRWLRQHGMDPERFGWELYETRLQPGERGTLREADAGAVLRLR